MSRVEEYHVKWSKTYSMEGWGTWKLVKLIEHDHVEEVWEPWRQLVHQGEDENPPKRAKTEPEKKQDSVEKTEPEKKQDSVENKES